jgi:hypothetical protein
MSRRRRKHHDPTTQPEAAGHSNGAQPEKTGGPHQDKQPGAKGLYSVLNYFNRTRQAHSNVPAGGSR